MVSVCDRVWLLPTGIFPNPRLDGLAVSKLAATPVPESVALRAGFDASLTMERLPPALPAAFGTNVTLKLWL